MKFDLKKYILPSVVSMILVGTYTNIDGLFIGAVAGDAGLAAINFAWPIVAFITSVGTGIGIGGAVMVNHLRGQNNTAAGESAKSAGVLLLALAGIAVTVLAAAAYRPLLILMGAEGEALRYAENYSLVVSLGALLQVLGAGMVVLLRNEGKTVHAMLYTLVGLVVHIFSDFLLVKRYSLYGVAFSTVVSQLVVAVLCLASFRMRPDVLGLRTYAGGIIQASTAPFGLNFVPSAVLLFTNAFAMKAGGTEMVSAYAVMSYAVYTYDYLCQGVCDGIQPIISYCHGAKDVAQQKRAVKTAVCILAIAAGGFIALTPALMRLMPRIFLVSGKTVGFIQRGFLIYGFSYPLKALVKLVCAYYYSVKDHWISNLLTYLDPLIFTPLTLWLLTSAVGENGIWMSLPVSQAAILLAFPVILLVRKRKK